ncbi:glycosyltransferase [Falsiroseomonas tokyonensis]|uniref:Glycosyltransferase n=1 Tax=Falsiroseomonas tokyonensis TaxID=430521 RepID=A0ABV7BRB8_9PROT|nr:glycosyltransferase [Falsiroseomonas tokyonensis]MBU8538100.1 glycosyltransferase [Falsiroseomonas tokyonensis]
MAERDKVCIIAHSHPEFSKGGGELAAHRQFETMRDAGRDVIFVGACEVGTQYAETRQIETVMPFGDREYVFSFAGMAEDKLAWEDAFQRRVLVDFLAGLDCDVYHFHHYWRLGADLIDELMEARPDARFVMTLHEMLAICLHHGQMVKTRARELCRRESPLRCLACFPDQTLERFAYRKATLLSVLSRFDSVIHPSEFIRARYRDWGLTRPRDPVVENYLGDAMLARPRRTADPEVMAHRFGFFGQPTSFKGLDVLLRALPMALRGNPDIVLTIFGAEREDVLRLFPTLEPMVEAAGPSLTFAGRYDPLDAVELMGSVGWVVVPSIWWENSPVVIQEARRAGTPLIVSDIGGMAEKVRPGLDGLHFKRAAPVDLARVMVDAANPALRAACGASLRDVMGRAEFLAALDAAYAPRQGYSPEMRRAAE